MDIEQCCKDGERKLACRICGINISKNILQIIDKMFLKICKVHFFLCINKIQTATFITCHSNEMKVYKIYIILLNASIA